MIDVELPHDELLADAAHATVHLVDDMAVYVLYKLVLLSCSSVSLGLLP
jgi:hypothetical protein